ncbi:MAG: sigma-54 dependent transcriptional regulator [Alysiella sp.]|uniref:sigma-54-dependent transcriptional regulator n=1 Tax=Alysiella sp. TaxID=1872483 RepID=UPI0026DC1D16|nr:sigma-54 dependent transcriptional regulator [Alysiella sp.]MDO4433439.1 sigma-54 dependent transcriptional regulator [Alysiella sp.]
MRSTDILIVDDEIGIREVLKETLEDEGHTVALAENAEEARRLRNQTRPAMVLLDIWMPDSDGITLLKEWATNGQLNMPVVMMSGHGSIDTAVEATKIGALDFLEKPIPLQKLLATVERALKYSESQNSTEFTLEGLGNCEAVKNLRKQIEYARRQTSPVLLLGESGSPFETVARAFQRGTAAWVMPGRPEHIADMPTELLNKASNGILYLGDIAQYNKNVLQSIGFLIGKAERHNTRIICTSSLALNELLSQSEQDTRVLDVLSSLVITIPPLREQAEDIDFLINHILDEHHPQGLSGVRFTPAALVKLRQYEWPGNLAQFKNVISSLALNAINGEVGDAAVIQILHQFDQPIHLTHDTQTGGFNFSLPLRELREQVERRYFEHHIRQENGNMSRVAQKVGLERTHLYRKLKQLGISFSRTNSKM